MQYSVIVPTLNPGGLWVKWIEALETQSIAPLAVYVVDSGSRDESLELSADAEFTVTKINKHEFNHGGTRQSALSLLNGAEYVVLLTQDAILANPDSIKEILAPFQDDNISAVCGRQLPRKNAGYIEAHSRLYNYPDHSSVRSFEDREVIGMKAAFLSNSFAAYRVSALNEVGGFPDDVIFGEDMYVAAKLLKSGHKIAYAADACVYHSHAYSLLQEFKRYFDMGVFHARNPWIRQEFGTAENQGVKFVISELRHLLQHAFWRIPEALLRSGFRFMGFRFGLIESRLPVLLKKHMSMNSAYFRGEIKGKGVD